MSNSTDPAVRTEFIASLRALADYLDAHQAVPVPAYGADIDVHMARAENGGHEEVKKVARFLGATISDNTADGGHYVASRSFVAIRYTIVSVSNEDMRQYEAYSSYWRCVNPDPV